MILRATIRPPRHTRHDFTPQIFARVGLFASAAPPPERSRRCASALPDTLS